MDNLPVCKKCCFCLPLRYGLLVWGYLKLAAALLALSFFIFMVVAFSKFIAREDVFLITLICFVSAILASEIILHIVFIIGAHRKMVKLLKMYYCYAVFMWVVMMLVAIVGTVLLILSLNDYSSQSARAAFISFDACCIIFSMTVQTFLVLSLRSEIIKLRSNCPYRFVKSDNNPEGTINSVKDEDDGDVSMYNTTVRIL